MHESRKLKIMINRSGGTSGKESFGYTLKLPSVWINKLNISHDDRSCNVTFDGETITLKKSDTE